MSKHTYQDLVNAGAPELKSGWHYSIEKVEPLYDSTFPYEVFLVEGKNVVRSAHIRRLLEEDIVEGCKKVVASYNHSLERKRRENEWLGRY